MELVNRKVQPGVDQLLTDGSGNCISVDPGFDRYGEFFLPEGLRPDSSHPRVPAIAPVEGYDLTTYTAILPKRLVHHKLSAAVSRENIFEVYTECIDLLSDEVFIYLIVFNDHYPVSEAKWKGCVTDKAVVQSNLPEFEDFLTHDSNFTLRVYSCDNDGKSSMEAVALDRHKTVDVYSKSSTGLEKFERTLNNPRFGINRLDNMRYMHEHGHIHIDRAGFKENCEALIEALNLDQV